MAQTARRAMFFRMVTRSLTRRRSRVVIAVLAVAIGATTLFALATIATDIPRQMTREMRVYGGNMLVLPADGQTAFDIGLLDQVDQLIEPDSLIGSAPYRYQTVRLNEQPYLAAGTDLAAVRAISPYWYVEGDWPAVGDEILVGQDIADWIGLVPGDLVELVAAAPQDGPDPASGSTASGSAPAPNQADDADPASHPTPASQSGSASPDDPAPTDDLLASDLTAFFTVSGIASTGGEEDSMIFLELADLEALTQVEGVIEAAEYSIVLNGGQVSQLAETISARIPQVSAAGVTRLTRSDSYVLDLLQGLLGLVTGIVLALTMIGVSTTMMAVVAERRNEIALLKALGATNRSVEQQFLTEGLALGLIGGLLGCGLGYGVAQVVSWTVFHRSVAFNWWLALATVALAAGVSYAASLLPVRRTAQIDPALVLRGE
ncbi:MAG: ABC transporter permease [Bifidobacteriaceae bacterium]|jgi:putative ABC transport system permease protein|nr:ABC transporter permease [Bifidobacteriaceae bacterium]